jgi:hypothetical protein
VTPDGGTDSQEAVWAYYISRRYRRSDLQPLMVTESDIPAVFSSGRCPLWAEAHLAKRGVTLLHDHAEFAACRDVPLGRPGVATAAALMDCRGSTPLLPARSNDGAPP